MAGRMDRRTAPLARVQRENQAFRWQPFVMPSFIVQWPTRISHFWLLAYAGLHFWNPAYTFALPKSWARHPVRNGNCSLT